MKIYLTILSTVLIGYSLHGERAYAQNFDQVPVITFEVQVFSCSDQSRIAANENSDYFVDLGTGRFFIDQPQPLFKAGAVDVFAVRPPGIRTLADVTKFELGSLNADFCVTKLQLVVNDNVVFVKTFDPYEWVDGSRYPINESWFTVSGDELHAYWGQLNSTGACMVPSEINGTRLQETLMAVLGDAFWHAEGSISGSGPDGTDTPRMQIKSATFEPGDFVTTSAKGSDTLHVQARFHTFINYTVGSALGADAHVTVTISFDITPVCADIDPDENVTNNSVSLAVSPIAVDDLDGDVVIDIALDLIKPEGQIAQALNERLDSVRASLGMIVNGLPACPVFSIQNASPASIEIAPPPFAAALGASLSSFSMCR